MRCGINHQLTIIIITTNKKKQLLFSNSNELKNNFSLIINAATKRM